MKEKRRGRPRVKASARKTMAIRVGMPPADYEVCCQAAENAGLSASIWASRHLLPIARAELAEKDGAP